MLQWLSENREWVFSGIGTTIVLGLISWFATKIVLLRTTRPKIGDTNPARPGKEIQVALAECGFWRGFVNVPGAPTQNELLLLLHCRFPKWTSRGYLTRSMQCLTQTLDESIQELTQSGRLKLCCGYFVKLSQSGLKLAEERAIEYA